MPLAVSSSTASALTPGYSVPPLTGCVMLGKSGDCSDTFLHWKAEMTSEAIFMVFTSAFLIKSKTSSSITYMDKNCLHLGKRLLSVLLSHFS